MEFERTQIYQESFDLFKASLMTEPILTYANPNLSYILFTDASKYAWACVLTQEKTHTSEEKENKDFTPYYIYEWIVLRQSNQLGMLNKRSLCNIHIYQEAHILSRRCRCNSKK